MIRADTVAEALRTITVPQGPALLYVTEGDAPAITILDRARLDRMPRRDLLLLRALLTYVTEQLDSED